MNKNKFGIKFIIMATWYGDDITKQLPKTLSQKDAVESSVLTKELGDRLARAPQRKIGAFKYLISTYMVHPGCPIQMEIRDAQNKRAATVGFYLQSEQGKVTLVVNHIQGVKGKREELEALSKLVKENWRVWVMKRIKRMAGTSKVKVAGSLPPLFYLFGAESSPEAYKRQLRQYRQTFRKAGITEVHTHKVVTAYPEEDRKFWKTFKGNETKEAWKKRHRIK